MLANKLTNTKLLVLSNTHTRTNIKLQSDGAVSAGRLPQINDRLKKFDSFQGESGEKERVRRRRDVVLERGKKR